MTPLSPFESLVAGLIIVGGLVSLSALGVFALWIWQWALTRYRPEPKGLPGPFDDWGPTIRRQLADERRRQARADQLEAETLALYEEARFPRRSQR